MNALAAYVITSSSVGWATGSIHGYLLHKGNPDLIIMSGFQGMVMGPYIPLIIPYMFFSDSKCPAFKK